MFSGNRSVVGQLCRPLLGACVLTVLCGLAPAFGQSSGGGTLVSTAPVALLNFDEFSGTTASDSSGSGNTLALSGGASFAPGKLGNALSVNGVDGAARATSTTGLNVNQALTIAAFLKPSLLAQGVWAYNTVAIKGDFSAGRGYGMNIRNGALNFVKLGAAGADMTSTVALATGVFQHVAITWDAATNEVKFYKDGSLVQTITNSSAITAPSDSDPLTVGGWPTGGSYFNGLIDDLRIYNRALSASEVSSLANASGGAPPPPPPADSTPPSVGMTAPAAGATVSGAITVSASASDNVGVAGVQFKLDGFNLGAEDSSAPYSLSWNTTLASNGSHTLSAVARDAAGNSTTSPDVSVMVNNPAPDAIPPSVSMTAPAASSTVSGTITVSASATDNAGVVVVQFKLDGTNLGAELTTAPYTISWNTSTTTNGPHALTAVARDAAGNITTSAGINVTVAKLIASILAPRKGAKLTTLTEVTVRATSAVGVSTVRVYDDKILIGSVRCINTPCLNLETTVDWPTTGLAAGPHSLYAVATDTLGNSSSSNPITVFK